MIETVNAQWLKRRIPDRHGAKSEVAAALGISNDKLTKVLRGIRQLKPDEIARAQAYFASHPPARAKMPPGFGEGDTTNFSIAPGTITLDSLCRALAPNTPSLATQAVAVAFPSLGLLPGDVLILDMNPAPFAPGDIVLAQVFDPDTATATTILREYAPPHLITRESGMAHSVIAADAENLRIAAKVVASFRAPQISAAATPPPKA